MHRFGFFTALAILLLASAQAMACQNGGCANGAVAPADCNTIGCVRPTHAIENLARTAERTLSITRATAPRASLGLCGTDNASGKLMATTTLLKNCGSARSQMPEPKAGPAVSAATTYSDQGASINAVALAMDAFAAMRDEAGAWAERWGVGGAYISPKLRLEGYCAYTHLSWRQLVRNEGKTSTAEAGAAERCASSPSTMRWALADRGRETIAGIPGLPSRGPDEKYPAVFPGEGAGKVSR
jgi:hypothetical protein